MQNMPPKIHAIEIGCKNLVKNYATKICTSKFNAKTQTKICGHRTNV